MKKKILVVDDKAAHRKLMKIYLSKNFNVATSENGLVALRMLHEGLRPDIIVTDLLMPEVDGTAFLDQIKSSYFYQHIPVMVLSSVETSTEKIRLLRAGAEDYLHKPFNPEELEVRIEKILQRTA
ncbi:MAG: response regulator transcription factor [candidate division Zixibacteria bacterium]|nr:response regulator transcription factor [candidate division Zixibacteria bacterium]